MTRRRTTAGRITIYVFTLLIMFFLLLPILWTILQSFQINDNLMQKEPTIKPFSPFYINYDVLRGAYRPERGYLADEVPHHVKFIPRSILNSFLVAVGTAVLSVLFGSLTAYTLSRVRIRRSRPLMVGVLAIRMLPPIGLIVPIYLILDTAHLIDSLVGLTFTYTAFMLPYSIWILYLYFDSIPRDMEDAARIDGCSRFQTVFKIVMPLSIPGITACSLFNLLMVWNEFFLALIITKSIVSYTLPVIISMFTQTFIMQPYDLMLAAAVIGFTVPLLLALFFQRYIVSGLTMGAFK